MEDLISKSALLEQIKKFCRKQRYLIPENIWGMVENFPTYEPDKENKKLDSE